MPNTQLIEYIQKAKVAGQGRDEIKSALVNAGWAGSDVEENINISYESNDKSFLQNHKIILIFFVIFIISFLVLPIYVTEVFDGGIELAARQVFTWFGGFVFIIQLWTGYYMLGDLGMVFNQFVSLAIPSLAFSYIFTLLFIKTFKFNTSGTIFSINFFKRLFY